MSAVQVRGEVRGPASAKSCLRLGDSIWESAADGVSFPASYHSSHCYYPLLSGLPLLSFISLVSVIVYFYHISEKIL